MDCFTFRRALHLDPAHWSPEMVDHGSECSACAQAAAAAEMLEHRIDRALAVNVPPQLIARIMSEIPRGTADEESTPHPMPPPRGDDAGQRPLANVPTARTRGRFAAVAAAIIGALLLVPTLVGNPRDDNLAAQDFGAALVQVIRDEFLTLTVNNDVTAADLQTTLREIGLGLNGSVENVRFATNCIIRGQTAAHWVLEGTKAPVTVFVIPNEVVRSRTDISVGSWHGLLLPSGTGTIAIVGAKGEPFREVSERITRAVRWSA